jgi:gliding motility-associated-like protein
MAFFSIKMDDWGLFCPNRYCGSVLTRTVRRAAFVFCMFLLPLLGAHAQANNSLGSPYPIPACIGDSIHVPYNHVPAALVDSVWIDSISVNFDTIGGVIHAVIPTSIAPILFPITVFFSAGSPSVSVLCSVTPRPNQGYPNVTYCTTPGGHTYNPNFTSGYSFQLISGTITLLPNGVLVASNNQPPGNVIVEWTQTAGCLYQGRDTVNFVIPQGSSFSYPDYTICASDGPMNLLGLPTPSDPGASFTVAPPRTGFPNTTGLITPSVMGANQYLITYLPPDSLCFSPSTRTVIIFDDTIHFHYSPDTACLSYPGIPAISRIPTLALNGTFVHNLQPLAGLNTSTGEITPAIVGPGTLSDIQYMSPHPHCRDTIDADGSVTILPPSSATFAYPGTTFCTSQDSIVVSNLPQTPGGVYSSLTLMVDSQRGTIYPAQSQNVGGPFEITYTVTQPCFASYTTSIYLNDPPQADIYYGVNGASLDTLDFCSNSQVTGPFLTTNVPNGNYSVSPPTTSLLPNGQFITSPNAGGIFSIVYETPSILACGVARDTFVLIISPAPTADFSYADTSLCPNADSLPSPAFLPQDLFTSTLGLVINDTSGIININASTAGCYTVTHTISVNGFCEDIADLEVCIRKVDTLTDLETSDLRTSYCVEDTFTVVAVGSPALLGTWSVPNGLAKIMEDPDSIVLYAPPSNSTASYNIVFRDYGYCGETTDLSVEITSEQVPPFSYPPSDSQLTYCEHAQELVFPMIDTLYGSFSAIPAGLAMDSITGRIDVAASIAGEYTIHFEPNASCYKANDTTLRIYAAPTLGYEMSPDPICENSPVEVQVLQGDDHFFYLNDSLVGTFRSSFQFDSLVNGDTITLRYRNDNGTCAINEQIPITVHPVPILFYTPMDSIKLRMEDFAGLSILSNDPQTQVHWQMECLQCALEDSPMDSLDLTLGPAFQLNPEFQLENVHSPATIIISLSADAFTCMSDTSTVKFTILPEETVHIFIPGAFTPNADNVNDTWEITWDGTVDPAEYEVMVFNKSGGMVLSQMGLTNTWNGGDNPDGIYRYIIRKGNDELYKGGLTIKRSNPFTR